VASASAVPALVATVSIAIASVAIAHMTSAPIFDTVTSALMLVQYLLF
jgi:hypothetical protein